MATQEITSTNPLQELSMSDKTGQYTLRQILGIWSIVTLPMVLLAWVAPPIIIPYIP